MKLKKFYGVLVTLVTLFLSSATWAFTIFPFQSMGPSQDLANGIHFDYVYPDGPFLFLTTEDGFQYYDFNTEAWTDRTWPGWVGRALYDVTTIPGRPGHLAMGGVNAWFKGTLLLSADMGASDDLVYECQGGRVTGMVATTHPDTTVFACTWSDVVDGELLRSDDGGQTYQLLLGHGHHIMTALQAPSSDEIYVAGDNYIARSLDGGTTWDNLQANLPGGLGIYCLLAPPMISGLPGEPIDKDDPFIEASFLLASNDNGLYLSDARTLDWQKILPFSCRAVAYTFVQHDTFVYWDEIYAVTFDGRLMVCHNGNYDNWVDATDMIAEGTPFDVVTGHGAVFVATPNNGVYVSAGIDGVSPVPPAATPMTLRAHPNPFNPATELVFSIPRDGQAVIDVFDLAGRKVERIFEGDLSAGQHDLIWQPRGLASGIYHAVLRQGSQRAVTRVSLVK